MTEETPIIAIRMNPGKQQPEQDRGSLLAISAGRACIPSCGSVHASASPRGAIAV